ncbi:MAG: penicillin acylase family protein [Bacteroidia bacterium]|nr:penicillin acylase family protein [Bacteroidia bacterium]
MKNLSTILFSVLLLLFVVGLSSSFQIGNRSIPPIGKFFSPSHGFWQNAKLLNKESDIPNELNLLAPATVKYDNRLVPHIFAQNERDLFYLQGYITAKHRLWQMDLSTRSAAGRISEVLGEFALDLDKRSRKMGLNWAAENAVEGWSKDPEVLSNLEAYRDGINDYTTKLSPKDYPIEFKLLNYAPEEWSLYKSALILKAMARTLCGNGPDSRFSNTLDHLGRADFDQLFPEFNPKQSPIIPENTSWDYIDKKEIVNEPIAPSLSIGYEDHSGFQDNRMLMGSNNWAVAPQKTADASTILAGDPHLELTLPSIWFEMQLNAPGINSYGVSIAGMQAIIIGFNDHIAWSVTNVGHDVMDWYEMKWTDETKSAYYFNGQSQEVEYRIESYMVPGKGIVSDTIRYSVWGPIWEAEEDGDPDLALRWLPHDIPDPMEIKTFELLNKAKDFDEYRKAISNYISPAQNFAFASKNGDIGLTVSGRLPLRNDQQGRFVQAGDDYKNEWQDIIPFEHNPFVQNPERGFISSANQHSTAPDYPYYYTAGGYFEAFRGRRVNDLLETSEDITVEDMKALQNDSYSIKAEEALPVMLAGIDLETLEPSEKEIISTLLSWDYQYEGHLKAPILFELWFNGFYFETWDEFSKLEKPVLRPETWRTIELMEQSPDSKWFDKADTEPIENLSDIIVSSFQNMIKEYQNIASDKETYTWQSHRNTRIMHMGRLPAFSRMQIETDGSRNTLNAVTSTTGPSWRMIVEFDETAVNALGVYPGGQSGNPASPYYDNMIDTWAAGEYFELNFLKDANQISDAILKTNELD